MASYSDLLLSLPPTPADSDDSSDGARTPHGAKPAHRPRGASGPRFLPFTVKGFLVSINKALTYEIDLELSEEQTTLLNLAHTTSYTYHNYPSHHLRKPDLTPISELPTSEGRCYRCRLKGVNFVDPDIPIWKINKITIHAKQLTDRGNGWVNCTIHQIDQYHRLIVDITILTTTGELSLREQLVSYSSENQECDGILLTT